MTAVPAVAWSPPAGCDEAVSSARSLLAAQNFEAALKAVSQCSHQQPPHLAALVLEGNILYLLARDSEAIDALENALRIDEKNADARYALGRIHYANARYEQSAAQFESLVSQDPSNFRAWDNLGLAREGQGRLNEAIQAHLKAIALTQKSPPDYDWPYGNLAELLMKQDDNRKAFDLAVEAAQRNPSNARNFYLAAKALSRLEQWSKCERWLSRAVELDPTYPEPHYLLGRLYRREGKTDEAARELDLFKQLRDKQPDKRR